MRYVSTRQTGQAVSLDDALVRGIADDGGLYLPDALPKFEQGDFTTGGDIAASAGTFLRPFFSGSKLANDLQAIIEETFTFPLPVVELPVQDGYCGMLELFHGPTAAFKDVGARFLAACLRRLEGDARHPLTILVATSGDTGGAVAAAFDQKPGMRVVVLYPNGRVSARQAHQLTCWSENVLSLAVNGSFDECQALVKGAMADRALSEQHRFSSANSINIGRLLPQAVYYAHSSIAHFAQHGRKPSYVIPTGNLGNAFACYLARRVGLPIGDIILATNANRLIGDFLAGAEWEPRSSIATLASAMDVGNPSNMERLKHTGGDREALNREVRAISVSDEMIEQQILQNYKEFGMPTCPHTATATRVWRNLEKSERLNHDWILVATAHAAKFENIVEPVIGEPVPVPPELADILSRPRRFEEIKPTIADLKSMLALRFGS